MKKALTTYQGKHPLNPGITYRALEQSRPRSDEVEE